MSILGGLYEKFKKSKGESAEKVQLNKVSKDLAKLNQDVVVLDSKIAPVAKSIEATQKEIREFGTTQVSEAELAIAEIFGTALPSLEQLKSTLANLEKEHKALLEKRKPLEESLKPLISKHQELWQAVYRPQQGEHGNASPAGSPTNGPSSLPGSSSSLLKNSR